MIETKDKAGHTLYVTTTPDCEDNEGGYYCEVYADEDFITKLDDFCVHPEDCDCDNDDEVEKYIMSYISQEDYSDVTRTFDNSPFSWDEIQP